jgi:MFS family permease
MRSPWPRRGLWGHHDFLRLWGAQSVSQLGSQVSVLALPLVAISMLHATAFEVALLGTFDMLPFLLFALPAGVWVDRLPRRPILVVADFGRGLVLASVPVVAALGHLTIGQLYVVGFLAGTLTVFFDVAYQSYLPSLVAREQLVEGNAKLEVSRSAAQVAGPGLAGLLIGWVTASYAIVADAISFVASAAFLFSIRKLEPPAPAAAQRTGLRAEILEGLRYLLGDARWRAIALYVATFNFFQSVVFSIFLVYAVRRLGLTAQVLGLTFAVGNVGWLLGAFVTSRVSRRIGLGHTLVLSGIVTGMPVLLLPLAPRSFPIPFLIVANVLVSLGIVLYNVTAISLMQALTPARLLGRMNASRRFVVWGVIPLGSLVGGALASTIGLRPTLFVGAIGTILPFLFLLVEPLRTIERLPAAPPAPEEELVVLPLESQV